MRRRALRNAHRPFAKYQARQEEISMAHVGESSSRPRDILLFTKPGCKSCAKARKLLDPRGWAYEEVPASPRCLRAVSAKSLAPQIFIDGTHIGSADDPQTYLARTT